ncbi:hypothetical protein GT348_03620 [Aristophania vespae]|uniref:Uncharacterized protein n=1 Tax=Aristophania vespae TaxID=2697033 RepID=A0A6P1NG72_9PROT|nr:hypothetical protein [Aristophania vespae]QHI95474.1 hypothetical protein GT348_03620 [Aristophania vespae]UMM64777.1 hypothetical protein DM15PD_17970 [Aristophania vespae]
MTDLSLCEASGVIALLLDSMTTRPELDLGNEALYGLNVVLRAVKNTVDEADISETLQKSK